MHGLSQLWRILLHRLREQIQTRLSPKKIEDIFNPRKGLIFIWQGGRKKHIHLSRDRQNAAIRDIG